MPEYLVFFVVDEPDDELASHIRARVRMLAGARAWRDANPGFFDGSPAPAEGPDSGDGPGDGPRTTGGYLRVEDHPADGDDARAFCAAVQAVSAEFAVAIELQYREVILGHVRAGVPDDGLEERLAIVTGEG